MLDHLLDARLRPRSSGRSWPVLSFSVTLHVAGLGAAVIAALLTITPIRPPDLREVFVSIAPPPPAPIAAAAAPPGSTHERQAAGSPREEFRQPAETIQPQRPAEDLARERTETEAFDEELDEPAPGGIPEGLPGGIFGGIAGGIVGGSPDGVPGGAPDGAPGGAGAGRRPGEETGEPVRVTGDVRAPRPIFRPDPEYPPLARRSHAEGELVLEIVVGRDGAVEDARILRGHPLFDAAALDAVKRWRYSPALLDGRPVRVYVTLVVSFKIDG